MHRHFCHPSMNFETKQCLELWACNPIRRQLQPRTWELLTLHFSSCPAAGSLFWRPGQLCWNVIVIVTVSVAITITITSIVTITNILSALLLLLIITSIYSLLALLNLVYLLLVLWPQKSVLKRCQVMSSIGEPIPWAAAARPWLFGRIGCEFHNPNPYLFVDLDHHFNIFLWVGPGDQDQFLRFFFVALCKFFGDEFHQF